MLAFIIENIEYHEVIFNDKYEIFIIVIFYNHINLTNIILVLVHFIEKLWKTESCHKLTIGFMKIYFIKFILNKKHLKCL